ncbi:MAG: GntR family transcriptional regulator [Desulfobacteraceae bacterium]|nr:GntR family transcriptional regulator [Desulfobacteraceae bacterium]
MAKAQVNKLPALGNDDFKPLYAQLTDAISQYIKNESLVPGDPIPSENDLIKHYGVSRMTVRLAIQRLATQGAIRKIQGKGTFVAESLLTGFVQAGQSLEDNLAREGITVENDLLEAALFKEPIALWLNELQMPKGSPLFKIKRLKRADQRPLGIEVRYFPIPIASLFRIEEFTATPMIEILNSNKETEVHRAVFRLHGESLLEHYTEILEVADGAQGLVQMETYYNKSDEPVMTGKIVLLSDRVELRYESKKPDSFSENLEMVEQPYVVVSQQK